MEDFKHTLEPKALKGFFEKSNKVKKEPVQLFSHQNGCLSLNSETLAQIKRNFDPNESIVTLSAVGLLGTGKSTWLSSIIYAFEKYTIQKDDHKVTGRFEIGHTQETFTQGLWVYPYPLRHPNLGGVQFMLLDMEGMGGVVFGQDQQIHKTSLIKLYTLCMTIASVITIHTNIRLDAQTAETLNHATISIRHLKESLKIDAPEIYVLIKDCKNVLINNSGMSAQEFFQKACGEGESLSSMQILGRPKPPIKFLSALENPKDKANPFTFLDGSTLEQFNEDFIEQISGFQKKKPCMEEEMCLQDLIKHIKLLAGIINSDNYESLFKESIQNTVRELLKPFKEYLLEEYRRVANNYAGEADTNMQIKQFQKEICSLRMQCMSIFEGEMAKITSKKSECVRD